MRRLVLLLFAFACSPPSADPDPALLEAVDWYTGVAGIVDDARAHELLEQAVEGEGPLALMWLARVHSTGRMGFPRDEERARAIAAQVIAEVERAAEAGVLEAVFLMGTAYDEGLGKPVDPVQAAAWHRRAGGNPGPGAGARVVRARGRGGQPAGPGGAGATGGVEQLTRLSDRMTALSSFCPSI